MADADVLVATCGIIVAVLMKKDIEGVEIGLYGQETGLKRGNSLGLITSCSSSYNFPM